MIANILKLNVDLIGICFISRKKYVVVINVKTIDRVTEILIHNYTRKK